MTHFILALILVFAPIARGAVRIWAYGPIQIAVFLTAGICVMNMRYDKEARFKRTPLDIPAALFLSMCLFSFINTRYFYSSIMEFLKFVNLGLLFYLAVNCVDTEYKIKRILNIILASSTAIAMFGILQYMGVIPRDWWDRYNFLSSTYVNHNHFAGYMELAAPLSIGMILSEKDIGKKALYMYSFLAMSSALALSMSRGAWFSITIAMIFMFIMIYRKKKGFFMLFVFLIFLAIAAIFIFNAVDLSLLSRRVFSYKELDFSGRIEIWKGTLEIIKHNWLLGTGIGTFIYNFPAYRAPGLNMLVNFSHNDYLQIASEAGVFSLALSAFMIFIIIKKGIITHSIAGAPFKKWISLSLVTGILSLSVHGLGDFNFYIPANAALFALYAGLIFNISSRKEKGPAYFTLSPIRHCSTDVGANGVSNGARPGLAQYRLIKFSAIAALIMAVLFIGASLASEIYIGKSQYAASRNDMEKAARLAIIAEKIMPVNSSGANRLAEIYSRSGNDRPEKIDFLKRSASSYTRALRLNPIDAWSWIGLGDVYSELFKYSMGDYSFAKDADMAYRKAIELDPLNSYYLKKFARHLFNIGEEILSSQFYKKAYHVISRSRNLPELPRAFMNGGSYREIADNALQAGDAKKALAFYKMAEEFLAEKEGGQIGQMRAHLKSGLVREAVSKYNQMKFSKKNKAVLAAGLADYCLRNGYLDTAARFAGRSLEIYPDNPEAYQVMYKISGKTSHAAYRRDLVSRILHFNKIPLSQDIKPGGLEVEFFIKEDLIKEDSVRNDIFLPAGMYEFKIKAKGKFAGGAWPHMIARFNSRDSMDAHVNSAEWKEYAGIVIIDSAMNSLEIVYDNDYYNPENMEDRNLYIAGVRMRLL